jgi:hypothetical protein
MIYASNSFVCSRQISDYGSEEGIESGRSKRRKKGLNIELLIQGRAVGYPCNLGTLLVNMKKCVIFFLC